MSESSTAPGTPPTSEQPAGPPTPTAIALPASADTPVTTRHKQGGIVSYTYNDPYEGAGGEDRTVVGIVIGVDGDNVDVAWLDRVATLPAGDVEPAAG
jgi:hypothetical protein